MTTDPRAELRSFLGARFPQVELTDAEDIFALGFVNSLFAMELVLFVERTFGLEVPNDELTLDNFRSIKSMAELVQRQAGQAQPSPAQPVQAQSSPAQPVQAEP
jgi:methoxymalonate biosynthesis acyl carrier protein